MATEPPAHLTVAASELLEPAAFVAKVPGLLGQLSSPPAWWLWLAPDAPAAPPALRRDAAVADAVRALLRSTGFKPSGRSKPASEYLVRAVSEGRLGAINPLVDACNLVSLHSGLPISVVDLEQTQGPLRLAAAPPGTRYVFNAAGQEIDVGHLLSLHDGTGPIAGPVKDCHRTKTSDQTRLAVVVVWGTRACPGRAAAAATWYAELLAELGIVSTSLPVVHE